MSPSSTWSPPGYRQLRLDQTALAGESLQRALELSPSHIRALRNYTTVLLAQGRFRENLEQTRKLAELDPQNPNHLATYEYIKAYFGENGQIEPVFDRLRQRYYNDPRFYDASASYYRRTHEYDRMIKDMLRTRVLRPSDAWAPGWISTALFSLGAAKEGEQWLEQTRQVNPDSRYLLMAGYERLLAQKQYGELSAFMRGAWMREATEGNYLGLGAALLLDGKPAETYDVLKESLARYPFDPATGNVSLSTDGALSATAGITVAETEHQRQPGQHPDDDRSTGKIQ